MVSHRNAQPTEPQPLPNCDFFIAFVVYFSPEVIVAQLVEWLLSTPETNGSNLISL